MLVQEKALEMQHQMLEEHLKRAEQKQQALKKKNEQKIVELIKHQNRICELIDDIAGAHCLAETLRQRADEYQVYEKFSYEVYKNLRNQQVIQAHTDNQESVYTTSDQQIKEQQQVAEISTYFERTYGRMKREMQQTTDSIQKV